MATGVEELSPENGFIKVLRSDQREQLPVLGCPFKHSSAEILCMTI